MNTGKTLFAQIMDFLPWSTFDRIVARYDGNRAVRKLSCAAQYQVMAFAGRAGAQAVGDPPGCTPAVCHFPAHGRPLTVGVAIEGEDWEIILAVAPIWHKILTVRRKG